MSVKKIIQKILLTALMLIYSFPIIWMYISATRTTADFISSPLGIPKTFNILNFVQAYKMADIGHHFIISVLITCSSVLIVTVFGALAAFSFSRLQYRGRNFLYSSFFLGLILPTQSFLVGMFILIRLSGLLNSVLSTILPCAAIGLPIAIFLMKAFFDTIPTALEESAVIEGAGVVYIFWKIILPITNAIVVTVIIFTTINVWNEFMIPFIMIQDEKFKPLTTSLYVFSTKHSSKITLKLAALTLIATPMFFVYFIFQKQIQKGITAGAIKT